MLLSTYEELSYQVKIRSSILVLDITFNSNRLGCNGEGVYELAYRFLKFRVDSIVLSRWIIPSRYSVPISRLEELKRLEVTERILEEL